MKNMTKIFDTIFLNMPDLSLNNEYNWLCNYNIITSPFINYFSEDELTLTTTAKCRYVMYKEQSFLCMKNSIFFEIMPKILKVVTHNKALSSTSV